MTAQITDTVIWKRKDYTLLSIAPTIGRHELFRPENYGMIPVMMSTACYNGYYCTYRISRSTLYLDNLTIRTADGNYPPLNNVQAHAEPHESGKRYSRLGLAVGFSGRLRLAADFIRERYRHMGFQETTSYRTVIDLTFEDGELLEEKDVSQNLQMMRNLQVEVENFLSRNWVPLPWLQKLKQSYGCSAYGNIEDEFAQYIRNLDPEVPLRLMQEIVLQKNRISWFIGNYLDYFERAHNYNHTIAHLNYMGIPPLLLTYLEGKVNSGTSEEQVVLALLRALLETDARDQWGENLPVIFERQYLRAQIDPALTDAIRDKLKWMKDNGCL